MPSPHLRDGQIVPLPRRGVVSWQAPDQRVPHRAAEPERLGRFPLGMLAALVFVAVERLQRLDNSHLLLRRLVLVRDNLGTTPGLEGRATSLERPAGRTVKPSAGAAAPKTGR
jgi:hypothetical protein